MLDTTNDSKYSYAGLVPLLVGAVGALFAVGGSLKMFQTYSLLILVFLTGSCWGALHAKANKKSAGDWQLGLTILIFLWGWMSYYLPENISLLMLMVGFWMVRFQETDKVFRKVYTESYQKMRNNLTVIVSVLHIVVFAHVNYLS